MTREAAEKFAAALDALAAIIRESAVERPPVRWRKVSEVARETGIAPSTLRELIARRVITASKVGRRYLVDPNEVTAYIQRNELKARIHLREVSAH